MNEARKVLSERGLILSEGGGLSQRKAGLAMPCFPSENIGKEGENYIMQINLQNLNMTLVVTVIAAVFLLFQFLYIGWARKSGTAIRIRPFQILIWIIILIGGIYSLITGTHFVG